MVTSHDFQLLVLPIMGRAKVINTSDIRRAFGECFSMSPNLCVHVWDEIEDVLPSGVMIFHLMGMLLFLKVYGTENSMAAMVQSTQNTYRRWARITIEEIHSSTYVSLLCLFV